MPDIMKINQSLMQEMEVLAFEVETLAKEFEQTNFFGHISNFPHCHYGYLMACMGKVDGLSLLWDGGRDPSQTRRMGNFLERYVHPGKTEENDVAVQMFRHTLMHTGALRFIYSKCRDTKYTWRAHFGFTFPADYEHYSLSDEDPRTEETILAVPVSTGSKSSKVKAFNMSLMLFVEDLQRAVAEYLADLAVNSALQANYDRAEPRVIMQEF